MKNLVSILLLLYLSTNLFAQVARNTKTNTNAWYMYFGDHKFTSKWGVHLEAQFRRSGLVRDPQQLLLRTGINYHWNASTFSTVGYCFVETHPYGVFPVKTIFPEHRLWEQLQLKNITGRFEIINRFRLEQRWMHLPVSSNNNYQPGTAVYQNRFRLLNRFSIPFKGKTIQDKRLYATCYDELFISFGKNVAANIFDQNRAYFAFGYKIPKLGKVELGYMQQLNFKADGVRVENNHTLQVGIYSTFDFYHHQ